MNKKTNWEKVTFRNSIGLNLAGLLYAQSYRKAPVVIVCHGFTGSKEGGGMALSMGEELGARGYNVLLFDFRGNGESEGLFERLTLTGQIDDLRSAVDWSVTSGMGPVFTLGRSFGGTTVICHAAQDPRVTGVCTWAAPTRLTELFSEFAEGPVDDQGDLYALVGEKGIIYLRKAFFDDLKNYNITKLAGQIAPRPFLIIHGASDDVVSPNDADLIFQNAGQPKELTKVTGADHQFSQHHRVVWDTMFEWLAKNL